jgi:hypothetical protein
VKLSFTLKEEHGLRMYENRKLRGIFRVKGAEVIRWQKRKNLYLGAS